MTKKKLKAMQDELAKRFSDTPIDLDDWNKLMSVVELLEEGGFSFIINKTSVGIFDTNDKHKMVGWTKDKDATTRKEALVSAINMLVSTHSYFKTS